MKIRWFAWRNLNAQGTEVKGFTLIELLIVMSILAIVTTFGISSFLTTSQRGRDAKRKSDLNTLMKGLEGYYNDNGIYPTDTTVANLCATPINCYLRTIPTDQGGAAYCYVRGDVGGISQSFQLFAKLERNDDPSYVGTYTAAGCAGTGWTFGLSSTNTIPQ